MILNRKKLSAWILLLLIIGVFISILSFKKIRYSNISVNQKSIELIKENEPVWEDERTIYDRENQDLKNRSSEVSPDGKKTAYFQHKFVTNIESIGDPDYTSLILEQGKKTDILFQSNFHISHFEWLNNNEIKVYKDCGSGCLLSYVVNIHNKHAIESIEKIFDFND